MNEGKAFTVDFFTDAVKLYNTGEYSIREIEEMTGVKKSTLYRNLQEVTDHGGLRKDVQEAV